MVDDEKSKGRKAKLFFSASIGDAVFALLDSPDKIGYFSKGNKEKQ